MNLINIKKLILVALLCAWCSTTSLAQGKVISQAYEILLHNFQAPVSARSTIVFRECDECDAMHVRVTDATRYSINGRTVQLEDFRIAILKTDDRDDKAVTVLHHLESDTVESIDASI